VIIMPLLVYLGTDNTGTLLQASEIETHLLMDGKDVLSFSCDNPATLLTATASVFCEYDNGTDDPTAVFEGFIDSVSLTHPRKVMSVGVLGKMDWYVVSEGNSNLLKEQGRTGTYNSGTGRLTLNNDEGVAYGSLANYVNPADGDIYYLIVSDATKRTTTVTLANGANNWIGFGDSIEPAAWGTETNSYTSVDKAELPADSTHWKVSANLDALEWNTAYYMTIALDLVQYSIPKSVELTNLTIKGFAKVASAGTGINKSLLSLNILTASPTQNYNHWGASVPIKENGGIAQPFVLSIDNPPIFTQGADYWEGGYVRLRIQLYGGNPAIHKTPATVLEWQSLMGTISYNSQTFDILNDPITSVVTNTVGTGVDYGAEGVVANDQWAIGIDYNLALIQAFTPQSPLLLPERLNCEINTGVSIGKGTNKNLFGCTGFEMAYTLCQDVDYHFWTTYSPPVIHFGNTANMGSAVTLDTPGTDSVASIERYSPAHVVVVWKEGIVSAATGVAGAQGIHRIQDKSILTETTAYEMAQLYATRYASVTYSIQLQYSGSPLIADGDLPRPGTLYDVTLYNNETGAAESYTDQPVRRISITNNGGDEHYTINMWLGLGSTPLFEKIPKEIEGIKRSRSLDSAVTMSSSYTPTNRHSGLLGVQGSADAYHVTSAQYTSLTSHGIVTNGNSHDHAGGDGAQIDHGGLAGLADDDHTQYFLKAGGTLTGDLTCESVVEIGDGVGTEYKGNKTGVDQWGTSGAPSGWTIGAFTSNDIVASQGGHVYPLKLEIPNSNIEMYKTITAYNYIAGWVYMTDVDAGDYLLFGMRRGSSGTCTLLKFEANVIYVVDAAGTFVTSNAGYMINTWTHIFIKYINQTSFHLYVDGVFVYSTTSGFDGGGVPNRFNLGGRDCTGYYDAIYNGDSAVDAWATFYSVPLKFRTTDGAIDVNGPFGHNITHNIGTTVNKGFNIGSATYAIDTIYADDFTNVASITKSRYIDPTDGLAGILAIKKEKDSEQPDYATMPFAKEFRINRSVTEDEVVEEVHHTRSLVANLDYLNSAVQGLTRDFQAEFDKINELLGALVDKLAELQSRIKSLEDRKPNPTA